MQAASLCARQTQTLRSTEERLTGRGADCEGELEVRGRLSLANVVYIMYVFIFQELTEFIVLLML